jgi:hypothetical protein
MQKRSVMTAVRDMLTQAHALQQTLRVQHCHQTLTKPKCCCSSHICWFCLAGHGFKNSTLVSDRHLQLHTAQVGGLPCTSSHAR